MYTRPTTPLPIGGVIDDAIKLYRGSFRSCWLLSLIGSLPLAVLGFYATASVQGIALKPGGGAQAGIEMLQAMSGASAGFFKWYLLTFLVTLAIYCALFAQMHNLVEGRASQSAVDALIQGLRRLPGAVLGSIIFAIATFIGLCLLFIPGIYLWGKLEFWLAAAFADDVGAIEGLGRSWVATTGNWWRSTTILTVALIIIFVLELLVGLVSGVVLGVMFVLSHVDSTNLQIGQQIARAVISVFILPMIPAVMLATYYDLKLRREGTDLAARAKSLQPA